MERDVDLPPDGTMVLRWDARSGLPGGGNLKHIGVGLDNLQITGSAPPEPVFNRGDANADGKLDVSDAVSVLDALFVGEVELLCPDAADGNDDGKLDIADAISILGYLFGGQGDLPAPFKTCGPDETEDNLEPCEFPQESCQ